MDEYQRKPFEGVIPSAFVPGGGMAPPRGSDTLGGPPRVKRTLSPEEEANAAKIRALQEGLKSQLRMQQSPVGNPLSFFFYEHDPRSGRAKPTEGEVAGGRAYAESQPSSIWQGMQEAWAKGLRKLPRMVPPIKRVASDYHQLPESEDWPQEMRRRQEEFVEGRKRSTY